MSDSPTLGSVVCQELLDHCSIPDSLSRFCKPLQHGSLQRSEEIALC